MKYHTTDCVNSLFKIIYSLYININLFCAVLHHIEQMMGDFATTHGFYSADWDVKTFGVGNAMGEGGEALTVTDPEEAWMFHIVSSASLSVSVSQCQSVTVSQSVSVSLPVTVSCCQSDCQSVSISQSPVCLSCQ
jgi:hypothetical protein